MAESAEVRERKRHAKRRWALANPEKHARDRARNPERQKGLPKGRYAEMLDEQNGVCIVCGEAETELGRGGATKRLAIDHDHRCCPGQKACGTCVRWLACGACNRMMGYARDDVLVLRRAADLLEAWQRDFVPPSPSLGLSSAN